MRHYTNLGAVPAIAHPSAERSDALLAITGPGARRIMRAIKKLPRNQQVQALDRALEQFDPQLPARVRHVAEFLHRGGMPTDRAVERALALSLADASIDRFKQVGYAYRRGEGVPQGILSGLGTGTTATSSSGDDAGQAVANVFKGIACSNGLQSAVTDLVGRNEGADAAAATNTGYEVLQGAAQCGVAAPAPAPPPPPPPPPSQGSSLAVPIAVGAGALLIVGGFVLYSAKKKK